MAEFQEVWLCRRCNVSKPPDQFRGVKRLCRECEDAVSMAIPTPPKPAPVAAPEPELTAAQRDRTPGNLTYFCTKCRLWKAAKMFGIAKRKNGAVAIQSWCKPCYREIERQRNASKNTDRQPKPEKPAKEPKPVPPICPHGLQYKSKCKACYNAAARQRYAARADGQTPAATERRRARFKVWYDKNREAKKAKSLAYKQARKDQVKPPEE